MTGAEGEVRERLTRATRAERGPWRDAAVATTLLLAAAYLGSGGMARLDPALAGYFGATLAAFFVAAHHVAAFWRRRPAAFYGAVLLRALCRPRELAGVLRHAAADLGAQRFLSRRGRGRWFAHLLLAWGTGIGFTVTLPLVFGWLQFEAVDASTYGVVLFSLPFVRFTTGGVIGWLVFHALHLAAAAILVGGGALLAARLRARQRTDAATPFHLAPLLLLLGVALTGLALPLAGQSRRPWLFPAAALAHEASIVALLVALPRGKLLHVFIRPLQIGAKIVRASAAIAPCEHCGAPLAPAAQLDAVQATLRAQGFRFDEQPRLCPSCRRRVLATCHGGLLGSSFHPRSRHRGLPLSEAA